MERQRLFSDITRFIIFIGIIFFSLTSCQEKSSSNNVNQKVPEPFLHDSLQVPVNTEKMKGQLLYMPVYSSVPYLKEGRGYPLSAFLSVHNTDFKNPIFLTRVLYFNTQGKLVKDYAHAPVKLTPLETREFFVPEEDTSGYGANFIVEWQSDTLVTPALLETVMVGITNGQGISFLSQGKVLGTKK